MADTTAPPGVTSPGPTQFVLATPERVIVVVFIGIALAALSLVTCAITHLRRTALANKLRCPGKGQPYTVNPPNKEAPPDEEAAAGTADGRV
ncbi:hypothetical protein BOX15_Mlig012676g1 [Macrostomum lignano]|uniref:Uncharacterized protein n=1 Tax=Macrostomum lignano TaxID=282301 RepID=A0A267F301_9PLAT|nr:hypothetical protein BOX15_Mlig002499g1 [Macrostomum lignano]PAA68135.1 hypothetical protein BOX15_Mlig012676g1 [Macrostomum lignano]